MAGRLRAVGHAEGRLTPVGAEALNDGNQDLLHTLWLVRDLRVREAQRRESGGVASADPPPDPLAAVTRFGRAASREIATLCELA